MANSSIASRTRASLLERIRNDPADHSAWSEFVDRYGPKIRAWCRGWSLQDSDADDVTQNVLVKLYRRMGSFEYDSTKSFRAWLKTVAHHAWQDFLSTRRWPGEGTGGSSILDVLDRVEAREDFDQRLKDAFDFELLARAEAAVRNRMEPKTWDAYCLLAKDFLSPREVADRVDMRIAMVHHVKWKVLKMLREEMTRLENGEGPKPLP